MKKMIRKLRSLKQDLTTQPGVKNHMGVLVPMDMPILSPVIKRAINEGRYEHQEAKELSRIIQPGERVLELGVGIGFVSTLILKNELL